MSRMEFWSMPSSKKTELAKNLIKYRQKLGLTQDDVAKQINKTRSAYAYYERTVTPPLNILKKLADIFNISIDELSKIDNQKAESTQYNINNLTTNFAVSQTINPAYKAGTGSNSTIKFDQLSQDEKNIILNYRNLPLESKKLIKQTIQDCLEKL